MNLKVTPKKHLGQHFLKDDTIACDIVQTLTFHHDTHTVLEIGPGTGVLTKHLVQIPDIDYKLIEIDKESIKYLAIRYPTLHDQGRLIEGDFLNYDIQMLPYPLCIIGNFPYNISSQIFFKVLDHKQVVSEVVCMLQKEVAERLCAPPGGRDYGILSVLLQAYYDMEYLFTVHEHVFDPPPKVKSGVIRARRNQVQKLTCTDADFKKIVKQAFSMRRKTLRNALKPILTDKTDTSLPVFDKRAEQLSVQDFVALTHMILG
ncbi:MAG: 16S rRNA (adenine(1518)-N(6)/adenine(1519)-N(6))-dimethyltransferase RsmA [Cytophagales bacterium]|nr:16S rRNA (adenine(1518)-N(6)/adenine(1519)-N(6))-dimethyltransferase RsmA [Cytophagales bacterium]